jgi:hypothetical protein
MSKLNMNLMILKHYLKKDRCLHKSISKLELDLVGDFIENISREANNDTIKDSYYSYHSVVRNLDVLKKPYDIKLSEYVSEVYREWKTNKTIL